MTWIMLPMVSVCSLYRQKPSPSNRFIIASTTNIPAKMRIIFWTAVGMGALESIHNTKQMVIIILRLNIQALDCRRKYRKYQPRVSANTIIMSIGINSRHFPICLLCNRKMAATRDRYSIVTMKLNNSGSLFNVAYLLFYFCYSASGDWDYRAGNYMGGITDHYLLLSWHTRKSQCQR